MGEESTALSRSLYFLRTRGGNTDQNKRHLGVDVAEPVILVADERVADTPMLSFESDGEHKYRRHLVTNLSQSAAKVLAEIQQLRGPWKSRHELAKLLQSCARSSAYNLIGELKIKGRIEIDGEGTVSLIRT
jgi:hypothetical protein